MLNLHLLSATRHAGLVVVVSAADMLALVTAFIIAAELFLLRLALTLACDGSRSNNRQCRFSGSGEVSLVFLIIVSSLLEP